MTHSTPACGRITGTTIIAIAVAVVFAVIGMSCAGPHANVFDALVANAPDARDEPRGGQQDGRISPAETVDDAPLGEARAGYPNDPGRDEGDGRRDHGRDEVDHPPPLGRRVAVAFKLVAIEPSTNPDSLECLVDGSPTKGATGAVSSTGPDSSQAGLAHSGSPEARTAIYLRVSTEEQDLAGQERELVDEAARRGWVVSARYAERVSGTGKVERREYDRLLLEASRPGRPWSHLLVWSLDRFSREATFTKATQAVLDLEKLEVSFHSLKEPTLDTPEDGRPNLGRDVLLALLPVIAAFESKRRSERVRVAMREIKAGRRRTRSGRPPGRPRRVTPELAARIRDLRARGLPWKLIAQHVGLPAGTCRKVRLVAVVENPHVE